MGSVNLAGIIIVGEPFPDKGCIEECYIIFFDDPDER